MDRDVLGLGEGNDIRICLLIYYFFHPFSAEDQQISCILMVDGLAFYSWMG
jgi:hypothetical protein